MAENTDFDPLQNLDWGAVTASHGWVMTQPWVQQALVDMIANGQPTPFQAPRDETVLPPTGTIRPTTVYPGQMVTISGAGFGSQAGAVHFLTANEQVVSATVTGWSDALVTATVPAAAWSGPISLLTADGRSAMLGPITVVGAPTNVAQLNVALPPTPPLAGTPETITVTALDASQNPVPGASVTLMAGLLPTTTQTDATGTATFAVTGFGRSRPRCSPARPPRPSRSRGACRRPRAWRWPPRRHRC